MSWSGTIGLSPVSTISWTRLKTSRLRKISRQVPKSGKNLQPLCIARTDRFLQGPQAQIQPGMRSKYRHRPGDLTDNIEHLPWIDLYIEFMVWNTIGRRNVDHTCGDRAHRSANSSPSTCKNKGQNCSVQLISKSRRCHDGRTLDSIENQNRVEFRACSEFW